METIKLLNPVMFLNDEHMNEDNQDIINDLLNYRKCLCIVRGAIIVKDIAEVRMFGNKKYHSPDNWKQVDVSKFIDAMLRHTLEFINDHDSIDAESGLPHYKHIACNLAFICDMMNRGAEK